MYNSSALSTDLPARLVILEQQLTVDLTASLSYTAADPYALRLAFHVGLDEQVEWVIARELLLRGLDRCTGLGDVQVWPSDDDPSMICVALTAPSGGALFEVPRDPIAGFLRDSAQIVPAGAESAFINIDDELADLLRCP